MQTNTITGIATVIAFRRQRFAGSLGIVAETHANTMQLDPRLNYAVSAGDNYGEITINGSAAKSDCQQTGKRRLALGTLIELARCKQHEDFCTGR